MSGKVTKRNVMWAEWKIMHRHGTCHFTLNGLFVVCQSALQDYLSHAVTRLSNTYQAKMILISWEWHMQTVGYTSTSLRILLIKRCIQLSDTTNYLLNSKSFPGACQLSASLGNVNRQQHKETFLPRVSIYRHYVPILFDDDWRVVMWNFVSFSSSIQENNSLMFSYFDEDFRRGLPISSLVSHQKMKTNSMQF